MSYILEALKRSEQERHQGELNPASIDTIMMPPKKVRYHIWPYLLIVVLTINVMVFLYFQFSTKDEVVRSDQESLATPVEQNNEVSDTSNHLESNLHNKSLQLAKKLAEQEPEVDTLKALPEHLSQTPSLTRLDNIDPVSKPENEIEKNYTDEGFEIIKPKAQTQRVPEVAKVSDSPVIEEQAQAEEESQLISPVQEEYPAVEQAQIENFDDIPHLNDMDAAFQKGIPNISFNSHIYSPNPADRRVMINDLYLRERQSFSGLTIETIGEFYIVLSKNSQQFKLPVLRDWFTPN